MTKFLSDDPSFDAARRRELLETAPPFPIYPDKPHVFVWWLSNLIDVCVNQNALDNKLPAVEPNPHRNISVWLTNACQALVQAYEVERWSTVLQMDEQLTKIKTFLADSSRTTKLRKRTLLRTQSTANHQDREIRNAIAQLNPMVLQKQDFARIGDQAAIARYGLQSDALSNWRSHNSIDNSAVDMRGNPITGRSGAGTMEPMLYKRKYWQTWECWEKKHNESNFYKYHAIVWGRREYAKFLRSIGFVRCPVYTFTVESFENGLTNPSRGLVDDAYLELAEMDFLGRLRCMGSLPYAYDSRPPLHRSLPTYILDEATKQRMDKDAEQLDAIAFNHIDELGVILRPAHRKPGLYIEDNNYGTSQGMFERMMFFEKCRLGIIRRSDLDYVYGIIQKDATKRAREGLSGPANNAGIATAVPFEAMQEIKRLNEMTPCTDYKERDERRLILEDLRPKS